MFAIDTIIAKIKNSFLSSRTRLEEGGERIDILYDARIDFNNLDKYQKSHVRRYEFAKHNIMPAKITGDFACGTGYGSIILSERSLRVIGIDIKKKIINKIRTRYKSALNVEFIQSNLLNLHFESYFDNIVSFETIEHLDEGNVPKLFSIFSKALKSGGLLIFSTPYRQERSREAVRMGFHKTYYIDENRINHWLRENNFSLECYKYQNYLTHEICDALDKKDFIIGIARRQ